MQSTTTPMAAIYQAQLEASRRCASAIFSGTERIDQLMLSAARHLVDEQIKLAESMVDMRNPQAFGEALRSGALAGNSSEMTDYQRQLVSIYTEMQAEIGRSFQEYVEQLGSGFSAEGRGPAFSSYQGRDGATAMAPMTGMLSMWETAVRQVTDLAKKNIDTARSAFDTAAEQAASAGTASSDAVAGTAQAATAPAVSGGESTGDSRPNAGGMPGGKRK